MTDKTLFLHIGGSKTGSTGIQNFLGINKSLLDQYDIAFENTTTTEYLNNNGLLLYNLLLACPKADSEVDELLLSYFGTKNIAICSSEYFQTLEARYWQPLIDATIRLGIIIKIIIYVRNVIPFLLSSYDQAVKRHGEHRYFDEWVDECRYGHCIILKIIVNLLPLSNIHVLHFEKEKNNLIKSFLDTIGIKSESNIEYTSQKIKTNRSLTNEERDLFISLNKSGRKSYTNELFNLLMSINSNAIGEPPSYQKETEDKLILKFNNQVTWINATFFNGNPIVSVLPTTINHPNITQPVQNNFSEMRILDWALKQLTTIEHDTKSKILISLNEAALLNRKNYPPEVPADFNALAYLLLNPDIVLSGIDPVSHYISHGKYEIRKYKFESFEETQST